MLISKGNPMLMGCSRYKDGYNFTYEAECDSAALLIFDAHMKPKERIELDSSMKCGNIFSVHVSGIRLTIAPESTKNITNSHASTAMR